MLKLRQLALGPMGNFVYVLADPGAKKAVVIDPGWEAPAISALLAEEGWEPEPGGVVARLQALYDQGVIEPDTQKRHELVWDAIRIHIEEGPFNLGSAGDQPMPVVVGDNFHNVSNFGVLGPWAPGSPGNQHPEQYWIEQ